MVLVVTRVGPPGCCCLFVAPFMPVPIYVRFSVAFPRLVAAFVARTHVRSVGCVVRLVAFVRGYNVTLLRRTFPRSRVGFVTGLRSHGFRGWPFSAIGPSRSLLRYTLICYYGYVTFG